MTPHKLAPEEKPQTLELFPEDDEHQGSNFLSKADSIDATGDPVDQQSITYLLIKSYFLLYQG